MSQGPSFSSHVPDFNPVNNSFEYYDEFADTFDNGQPFGGVGGSARATAAMYPGGASLQAAEGALAEWDHDHAISYDPMQGVSSAHGRRRSPY